MPDPDTPKKIAKNLLINNLEEVKRLYKEQMKEKKSEDQNYQLMEQVAQNLNEQFHYFELIDSVSDQAFLNYFYLIACSDDYKELLNFFDPKLPINYEALLFKAIEIHDSETVNHLVTCKPELLNIRLKKPFGTTKMRDFLLQCSWCTGLKESLKTLKIPNDIEPHEIEDFPCFEEIQRELKKRRENRA